MHASYLGRQVLLLCAYWAVANAIPFFSDFLALVGVGIAILTLSFVALNVKRHLPTDGKGKLWKHHETPFACSKLAKGLIVEAAC